MNLRWRRFYPHEYHSGTILPPWRGQDTSNIPLNSIFCWWAKLTSKNLLSSHPGLSRHWEDNLDSNGRWQILHDRWVWKLVSLELRDYAALKLLLFLFYSHFWNFSNVLALIFMKTIVLLRASKTEGSKNSRLKCLALMDLHIFSSGRPVGMTEWNGCHLSGCYLNKNAIVYSAFLPSTAPPIKKKELLMCGTARVRNILKEISPYVCHIHQILFCVCVQRHSTHSTYIHICLFLISLSICLWYPKIWFTHYRQRARAWQGPGALMSYHPPRCQCPEHCSTQNRTSQGFHGLAQLFIEH